MERMQQEVMLLKICSSAVWLRSKEIPEPLKLVMRWALRRSYATTSRQRRAATSRVDWSLWILGFRKMGRRDGRVAHCSVTHTSPAVDVSPDAPFPVLATAGVTDIPTSVRGRDEKCRPSSPTFRSNFRPLGHFSERGVGCTALLG